MPETRPLQYEIRVFGAPDPIIKQEFIPTALCTPHPPQREGGLFLGALVKKYDAEVMALKPWTCWNCSTRAVSITHTPVAFFHLPEPTIVDFAQPVCVTAGACDKAARKMMADEMRLSGAPPSAAAAILGQN